MSDAPVRTRIRAHGRWWPFQEFMIKARAEGPVEDVEFRGARAAAPTREVLAAIEHAKAIIIGPSNPVISIEPILSTTAIREAISSAGAPVVAVSPLVGGQVIKGPTEAFLRWARTTCDSTGIAAYYEPLIHGLVADEPTADVPVLETQVLMDTPRARRRLAEETLRFALALAATG
jgi:LPPG:FO 2-phospho-L-lactate transferase